MLAANVALGLGRKLLMTCCAATGLFYWTSWMTSSRAGHLREENMVSCNEGIIPGFMLGAVGGVTTSKVSTLPRGTTVWVVREKTPARVCTIG